MQPNVLVKINALDNTKEVFTGLKKNLDKTSQDVERVSVGFGGLARSLAGVAAAYISVGKAYDAISLGVQVAADLETAEIGLATLLGSADEASATVARLKVEAARTPFELPGLAQATQLLASVTKDGDRSIDILLDIGEGLAAMGKGQAELDRIIANLQQIAAVGKAASIDIKQFAFAGIPIYEMLTETTGKAGEELEAFITEGGVTFDLLTRMFDEANNEGGRFFNAFANQAGSFNQAASNMKDSFGIMMADIVTKSGLFDAITQAMVSTSNAMANWQGIVAGVRENFGNLIALVDERTGLITHLRATFDSLAVTFREYVKPSIDTLVEALIPLKPLGEVLAQIFGTALVVALHQIIFIINMAVTAVGLLFAGLAQLGAFIADVLTFYIEGLATAIRVVAAVFQGDWAGAVLIVQEGIQSLVEWVDKLVGKFERAIELAKEIGGGAIDFVKGVLPGRASGGPVSARTPYMVGEHGPELFVPNNSGSIIPNGALAGYTAGGSNIVINIAGTFMDDRDAARRLSDEIMATLRQQARL